MNSRIDNLKQLIAASGYPIDEAAVAEAIILRSQARGVMPDIAFRIELSPPRVRSFRPHRSARSFRLARAERRAPDHFASPSSQLAPVV